MKAAYRSRTVESGMQASGRTSLYAARMMDVRGLLRARSWCALGLVALSISGCHIHNTMPDVSPGGSPSGNPTANSNGLPTTDASTQFSVNGGGGNVPILSQGVGGTLTYVGSNAISVTGTFTLSTVAPVSAPPTTTNALIYFETQLGANATFNAPFYVSPVVFPDGYSTSGTTFTETLYDASGNPIGAPLTGAVSGQSVTFPAPPNGSFPTTSTDTYFAVISS